MEEYRKVLLNIQFICAMISRTILANTRKGRFIEIPYLSPSDELCLYYDKRNCKNLDFIERPYIK